MKYIFGIYIAVQYLVSFFYVDFFCRVGTGYFAALVTVFALMAFVVWNQKQRWGGWIRPRYLKVGNSDMDEAIEITILFAMELFYLIGIFFLPHALHPDFSMKKTDIYIALAAEVCIILLLFMSRLDSALVGEKKPVFWYWRILPVSTLMIIWILQHHWNPFWPQDPWRWAHNMVLIFLMELVCNLGVRYYLASRISVDVPQRTVREKKNRFWNWLSTAILTLIVITEPLSRSHITRVQLDNTERFLSGAVFGVQLICILCFWLKRPVWSKRLIERTWGVMAVPEEKLMGYVEISFLIFCLLVFGNILPYFLYMEGDFHKIEVTWIVWWAVNLWRYAFCSPLYHLLIGSKEMPPLRYRIPWLSLSITVWMVWNFPLPYDLIRCVFLIICLFLLECVVLLTWKIHKEKRKLHNRILNKK